MMACHHQIEMIIIAMIGSRAVAAEQISDLIGLRSFTLGARPQLHRACIHLSQPLLTPVQSFWLLLKEQFSSITSHTASVRDQSDLIWSPCVANYILLHFWPLQLFQYRLEVSLQNALVTDMEDQCNRRHRESSKFSFLRSLVDFKVSKIKTTWSSFVLLQLDSRVGQVFSWFYDLSL